MAYVFPDGTIKLLQGVKNDPDYNDTILFYTIADQYNYFQSKAKYTFTGQSYTRKNRGVIYLEALFDNVYDCNYLMYQNSSFGDKWFYAFITRTEYISNMVTAIYFEIDVLQTYMTDYDLLECYVERMHTKNDDIGENTTPEPIESFRNIIVNRGKLNSGENEPFRYWGVCIAATVTMNQDGQIVDGNIPTVVGNLFSGLRYHFFADYNDAGDFLYRAVRDGKQSGIISVFMYPLNLVHTSTTGQITFNIYNTYSTEKVTDWRYTYGGKAGPRNNKLYTGQYNRLLMASSSGDRAEFNYEQFSTGACSFDLIVGLQPNPEFILQPQSYAGGGLRNVIQQMVLSDLPQCAWVSDAFQNWLAQNKYRIALNVGEALAGTALMAAAPGVGMGAVASSGASNLYNSVKSDVVEGLRQAQLPPQAHGQQTGGAAVAAETFGFTVYNIRPTPEACAIIDDYFDAYGYAIKKVIKPTRDNRQNWTFVKTRGCIIGPGNGKSVPADDARKIQAIYDNGIRFWRVAENIGNYDLSNDPI